MNGKPTLKRLDETYNNNRQEGTDGAKSGLGRCYTTNILRGTGSLDSHVQGWENAWGLGPLRLCPHGRRSRWVRETMWWTAWRTPRAKADERPFLRSNPLVVEVIQGKRVRRIFYAHGKIWGRGKALPDVKKR